MNDAEVRIKKAEAILKESPMTDKGVNFGDARSIGAWIMPIFMPILFFLAVAVVAVWGISVAGSAARIFSPLIEGKRYDLIAPYMILAAGTAIWFIGWFLISLQATRKNVWIGLLMLCSVCPCTAFGSPAFLYGIATSKENGFWAKTMAFCFLLGLLGLCEAAVHECVNAAGLIGLVTIPGALLILVGQGMYMFAWISITTRAFTETKTQGFLCLLIPLYAPIYAIVRFEYLKTSCIVAWIGFVLVLLGTIAFGFGVVLTGGSAAMQKNFDAAYEAARAQQTQPAP